MPPGRRSSVRSRPTLCGAYRSLEELQWGPGFPFNDKDPEFGAWLSGIIDGEGCFTISVSRSKKRRTTLYIPGFGMSLRGDDLPVLLECIEKTGIGNIDVRNSPGQHIQYRWSVKSSSGAVRMVRLLERHPLRAKKSRDFEIWKRAVLLRTDVVCGGPHVAVVNKPIWDKIATLRSELMRIREFDPSRAVWGE